MSPGGIWIVDGHNVIYQVGELRILQESGNGQGARDALVERCRRFALRKGGKAVVVFDGRDDVTGPPPENRKNLQVIFAAEADMADGRIVALARRHTKAGKSVVVVTDDIGLRGRLPRGASARSVAGFWEKIETAGAAIEKPRFAAPDIEARFLEAEPRILKEIEEGERGKRRGRPKKKRGG